MNTRKYLGKLKRWQDGVDGVYELAMFRLNAMSEGKCWFGYLSQVDVINTIVQATRDHDAGVRH